MTAREFLRRHWQKRPLFVRAALPALERLISVDKIAALAARDDVESRIVRRKGARRQTTHGPFLKLNIKKRDWTVLVSGLNLHHAPADRLLRRFGFVPLARVDDLMVSYATPGGGVGPHTDSYDVFLLQGAGRRRWRVWFKGKILEYAADAGDLLYLPPGVQHDGVALEPCLTYSVGFRVPRDAELGAAFLDFLHERGLPDGRYRDPDLRPARHRAQVPPRMVRHAEQALRRIRWTRADVARFLGEYLTLPKPHVVFRKGGGKAPLRAAMVRLDPATQLLYSGSRFFVNGETVMFVGQAATVLRELAERRSIPGRRLADAGLDRLAAGWREAGWAHFERA
ncbi:MAG: JmjC domain-containing protein [Betaproteobacteria bacterium]